MREDRIPYWCKLNAPQEVLNAIHDYLWLWKGIGDDPPNVQVEPDCPSWLKPALQEI